MRARRRGALREKEQHAVSVSSYIVIYRRHARASFVSFHGRLCIFCKCGERGMCTRLFERKRFTRVLEDGDRSAVSREGQTHLVCGRRSVSGGVAGVLGPSGACGLGFEGVGLRVVYTGLESV